MVPRRCALLWVGLLTLVSPLGSVQAGEVSGKIAPNDPRVLLFGRWDRRAADRAITVNTGSQIIARFSGSSLAFTFDTSPYKHALPTLWVRRDEGDWREVEVAERIDVATTGAADQPHVARVVAKGFREWDSRWTPPLESALVFTGVVLGEGGRLMTPPPPPKLRIEFLGDSITEGVLAVRSGSRDEWPKIADGRRAFAFQTAEILGAESRVVGFGRHGITIGGNGGVPRAIESFPYVYAGVEKGRLRPAVVVINLGTNDRRKAKPEQFAEDYLDYASLVRQSYPRAEIFCMRPFNGAHESGVGEAVRRLRAGGDKRLHYVDTAGWIDPEKDTTDGLHPNIEGHRKGAEKLAAVIRQVLWP